MALRPDVPHVAVFDTAFHQSIPAHAHRYAVPEPWYVEHGVRRYGFHGISYAYVAKQTAQVLGRPLSDLNLIVLHLGNGASGTAISAGKSVDTSMGLTPLEGLVMGTRGGDLDPGAILHLLRHGGMSVDEVDRALNSGSGMLGLCGVADMRDALRKEAEGDGAAHLAIEVYVHRIRKYIGAYMAVLGRVDAIVFTGGVGENSAEIRRRACHGLDRLGVRIDDDENRRVSAEARPVHPADGPIAVLVVPTNEELEIAEQTLECVSVEVSGRRP
jgi:acetate kinase